MSNIAAARAVQKVRLTQLNGIQSHIRRWGPLSEETTPTLPPNSEVTVLPNPFLPRKWPSGKTRPPVYSLRRQADLVKAAKAAGLLHLLPPGPKTPRLPAVLRWKAKAVQKAREAEQVAVTESLRVQLKKLGDKEEDLKWLKPVAWAGKMKEKARGADLGTTLYAGKKKMFKGHKWERLRNDRRKKQAILLRDMKKRVYNYKNYYKRRKPDPLKPPRSVKAPKLPF
ncbi:hypothetical protein AN958_03928 [Leucoagaricus sp. SymC.cos]|nr:hypothetical protein AN958_03928 [Leucoagaricus sp. SymC.cos]